MNKTEHEGFILKIVTGQSRIGTRPRHWIVLITCMWLARFMSCSFWEVIAIGSTRTRLWVTYLLTDLIGVIVPILVIDLIMLIAVAAVCKPRQWSKVMFPMTAMLLPTFLDVLPYSVMLYGFGFRSYPLDPLVIAMRALGPVLQGGFLTFMAFRMLIPKRLTRVLCLWVVVLVATWVTVALTDALSRSWLIWQTGSILMEVSNLLLKVSNYCRMLWLRNR